MNTRALLFAALILVSLDRLALGIITIGPDDGPSIAPPPDGAPWDYVGELSDGFGARASGVYLGNGYMITANHVDTDINEVTLDNQDFTLDSSFTPVVLQNTDMRIFKLAEDPGLPMLPMINASESAFNQQVTMIGWGVGKGTPIPNQGWNWADDTTRMERWATNTTLGSYYLDQGFDECLQTQFNISAGASEGQLTLGDSGGGLFAQYNGVWTLVGLNEDVTTSYEALYDNDPTTPGNQPDYSYFSSITQFTSQIEAIIGSSQTGGVMQYWDGTGTINDGVISGGGGKWNNSTKNWANASGTGNAIWGGGTAVFAGTGGTVTLATAISAQGLDFESTGYVISGPGALTLTGDAPTITVSSGGDVATINAKILGIAGLTANGAGTLILGNSANGYTGGTMISNGTLQIGTAGIVGSIGGDPVSVSNDGTLSVVNEHGNVLANDVSNGTLGVGILNFNSAKVNTVSGMLTDGAPGQLALSQSGSGAAILTNANNAYSGGTTVSNGILQIGTTAAPSTIGSGPASIGNGGTLTLVNGVGNVLANDVSNGLGGVGTLKITSPMTNTLSGALTDGSGQLALTQNGRGTTILTGTNTYSGATDVNAGTLQIGTAATAGTIGSGPISVAYGGSLSLVNAQGDALTNDVSNNGGGIGTLKINATGTNTLSGTLADGTGQLVVTQSGSGTTILNGPDTYTGVTNVTAGTLQVGDGTTTTTTLATSEIKVSGSGTLAMNLADGSSFASNVLLSGTKATFQAVQTGTNTINGVISGAGLVQQNSPGTTILTNANTYTGATVIDSGTLLVDNTAKSATGTGTVYVNNNGTLGGSGTIAKAVTLNLGGTIAPAADSGTVGVTLNAGSLTWNGGGTLSLQIAPGFISDELALTGKMLEGTNGDYFLDISGSGIVGESYTLATFASTTFAANNFILELPQGYEGVLKETSKSLTLDLTTAPDDDAAIASTDNAVSEETASDGDVMTADLSTGVNAPDSNSVVMAPPVPEPRSAGLLGFSFAVLLGMSRWRRRTA